MSLWPGFLGPARILFVELHQTIPHAINLGSKAFCFRDFFQISLYVYVKTNDPFSRSLLPQAD